MPKLMKLKDVERQLNLSRPTLIRMVKRGKLQGIVVGNAYRVTVESFENYKKELLDALASAPTV